MSDDVKVIRDAVAAVMTWMRDPSQPPEADAEAGNMHFANYRLAVSPDRIARLLARLEEAERDAARLGRLHQSLEDDGYGYWLPEKCVKPDQQSDEPPTMDEFRTFVDALLP